MTTALWIIVAWFVAFLATVSVMALIVDPIRHGITLRRLEAERVHERLRQQRDAISKLRCRALRADRMALEPLLRGRVIFGSVQPQDVQPTTQVVLRNGAIYNVALEPRLEPDTYIAWEVGEETAPMEVVRE